MTNSIQKLGLWHGVKVICVPDDDEEARAAGFSEEVIKAATQTAVGMQGRKRMYCRASLYERLKKAIPAA